MKNKNFIVGLFILISFVGIIFFTITTFVKSEFFNAWIITYAKFEDTFGLKSGNDVTMRGQKVGYVKNLYLTRDHVLVKMKINKKYQNIISKECTAELLQKNFVVGDWWISLKQSSLGNNIIANNDTLNSKLPIHITKTVSKATKLVETVEDIFQHIMNGDGALGNLYVSDSLIEVAQSVGANTNLLLRKSNKFFNGAENTLTKADTLFDALSSTTLNGNKVLDSVAILTYHLNNSVKSANILINELSKTPKDIKTVLVNFDSVVSEIDTVFQALENHWLLRGTVNDLRKKGK